MRAIVLTLLALWLGVAFSGAIEAQSVSQLGRVITKAAKKQDYDTIKEALGKLGDTGDKKAAGVIVKSLGLVPIAEIFDAAVDALVVLGSENVGPTFEKLMKKKRPDSTPLVVIVSVAEKMDDDTSEDWILTCLEKGDNFVARNAIPVLEKRRSKKAIPILIDMLEKVGLDPSTESYRVRDALVSLTGYDFDSIEDWRNFWETRKDTLDPKNLDKEFEGPTGLARKMPGTYKPPEFFGVEILSNRIVFVVDVSGSMNLWDKTEDGGGEENWRERRRMTRVKEQMKAVVSKMPPKSTFNIIRYSDSVVGWQKKGAVPASAKFKKSALKWIDGMNPTGATWTDRGLERAFQEKDVDTIILLSDGAPTRLGEKSKALMEQIHEQVTKMNKLAKVTLHTFGFVGEPEYPPGQSPPSGGGGGDEDLKPEDFENFLRKLAEDNDGKFTAIK